MIGLFFFVLSFLILGLFFGVFRRSAYYAEGRFKPTNLWRLTTVLLISMLAAAVVPIEVGRIDGATWALR